MTDDEFNKKFKELWKEYDSDQKKDFLLAIVTFDDDDEPDDIYAIGKGCGACITEALVLQVKEGTIKHADSDHPKTH